jgi:type IV secretion system protein VirB10
MSHDHSEEAPVVGRFGGSDTAHEGGSRESESSQGIPDERGIPSVNRIRSVQSRVTAMLGIGLASVTALSLLGWYYHRALSHPVHIDSRLHETSAARAQTDAPLPPLGPIHPPRGAPSSSGSASATLPSNPVQSLLGPPPPLPAATLVGANIGTGGYAAPPGGTAAANRGSRPHKARRAWDLDRRLNGAVASNQVASPVPAGNGSNPTAPAAATVASPAGDAPVSAVEVGVGDPAGARVAPTGQLQGLLAADTTPAVSAEVLPTQRFLIPKGAFIDCTLETAIDSTLPGMTTCITATDTFGADGKIVLLERGTKLVGETRGTVQQGQARVFVLWTEARTPAGVVVPLASPGTDALGRSGLAGQVDRHFFERFGAALLISMVDIGIQSAAQPGNGGVVINSSTPETILTEILRSTLNIPPTIRIPQGERIQVLVARDLDFRRVYQLKLLQARATTGTSEPAR